MSYKGFYKVKNHQKYKGDPTKCVFRSLWERKFMKYCDLNERVLKWSSEEVRVPYLSPIDGRFHYYYVDFWVLILDKDGEFREYLIEIKPKRQLKKPEMKGNKTSYLREMKTYIINTEKWKSAEIYCRKKNWFFKIMTEKELFGK